MVKLQVYKKSTKIWLGVMLVLLTILNAFNLIYIGFTADILRNILVIMILLIEIIVLIFFILKFQTLTVTKESITLHMLGRHIKTFKWHEIQSIEVKKLASPGSSFYRMKEWIILKADDHPIYYVRHNYKKLPWMLVKTNHNLEVIQSYSDHIKNTRNL
ncbi:MAG TPA: hypothetical protein GYA04_00450 [Acholeplasma sp.]|nr:hypothetical protein [Acholeplasma sp.]